MTQIAALSGGSGLGPAAERHHRLVQAASQFEGILLAQWWQNMRHSGLSGDPNKDDPASGTLMAAGLQAVTAALARDGGIGLGDMIVRSLEQTGARPPAQPPLAGVALGVLGGDGGVGTE